MNYTRQSAQRQSNMVTKYHDFFVDNIEDYDSVIDLGSGRGDVTYDMACKTTGRVVGVELNSNNVRYANQTYSASNLEFVQGNLTKDVGQYGTFDTVVLSNVLEHLDNRENVLRNVVEKCDVDRVLLRVPYFEREWTVAMKKELGVAYFLDKTHKIEYEIDEFEAEMDASGLDIVSQRVNWGEIWAVCKPRQ